MLTINFLTEFILPASSGWVDLGMFFPGKTVKVDQFFRNLISQIGSKYAEGDLRCYVFETAGAGGVNDSAIMETFALNLNTDRPDANKICPILAYLGGEGAGLLQIPEGQEEVNLILGYVYFMGIWFVLFVEHELEKDVEEIHLHVRVLNCWKRNDTPMVLVMGQ